MVSPIILYPEFSSLPKNEYVLIEAGYSEDDFKKEHLIGAIYLDLDRDLTKDFIDAKKGGRHPLPSIDDFVERLHQLGITKQSKVIVYDRNFGANSAARCWWMLTALGIDQVQVLSGGFQYAKCQNHSTTNDIVERDMSQDEFPKTWLHPIADIKDVEHQIQNENATILDVRSEERYQGISEPIDPIAGHIPSAKNIFFKENLKQDGTFKSKEELYRMYASLYEHSDCIITHCGSGVTACHTILSMVYAGFPMPSLYVGSWSEWCRNHTNN